MPLPASAGRPRVSVHGPRVSLSCAFIITCPATVTLRPPRYEDPVMTLGPPGIPGHRPSQGPYRMASALSLCHGSHLHSFLGAGRGCLWGRFSDSSLTGDARRAGRLGGWSPLWVGLTFRAAGRVHERAHAWKSLGLQPGTRALCRVQITHLHGF